MPTEEAYACETAATPALNPYAAKLEYVQRRVPKRALVALAAVLAAGLLAGCGGGDDAGSPRVHADFYMYFQREHDARGAAGELRRKGYETELRSDEDVEWLVIATGDVPKGQMEATEGAMRLLAYEFNGDYDGADVGD